MLQTCEEMERLGGTCTVRRNWGMFCWVVGTVSLSLRREGS